MVAMGLMLAAFTLAISWHISILFIGILLLRLAGQGLSAHTAQTAMTKFFNFQRGKALSIADLGYPLGEAFLTLVITALLPFISWRLAWGGISIIVGILLIPFIYRILDSDLEAQTRPKSSTGQKINQSKIYKTLIRDKRFYLHLPAVILPAFWATSLFLYQFAIGSQLGWSPTLIASALIALALARIISSLAIGPMVDHLGAKALFPYYLLPLAGGLFIAWWHPGSWSAFAYMFLLGITLGIGGNITSSLWVDMYGKESVGTVRSLFSSLMIFCASLSPFMMGYLIDSHIPVTHVLMAAIISLIIATILAFLTFRNEEEDEVTSHRMKPVILDLPAPKFTQYRVPQPTVPIFCFNHNLPQLQTVYAQYGGRFNKIRQQQFRSRYHRKVS